MLSESQVKINWIARLNNKMNTKSGYFHIGIIWGAITAIIFDLSALYCVGYMLLGGLIWGIGGYLKFKFMHN